MRQMRFTKHNEMIQTLRPRRTNPTFRMRVHVWTLGANLDHGYPLTVERCVKSRSEFAVSVPNQVRRLYRLAAKEGCDFASLLRHPNRVRVDRHAGQVDAPRGDMDEK